MKAITKRLLVFTSNSQGTLIGDVQDLVCALGAGYSGGGCVVSRESVPTGQPVTRNTPAKIRGQVNYLGTNGISTVLELYMQQVRGSWFKCPNRRSQGAHLTWERFADSLVDLPVPEVRTTVTIGR